MNLTISTQHPEIELLIKILKRGSVGDQSEYENIGPLTWSNVIELARQNAVLQAFDSRIKELRIDIPGDLQSQLKNAFIWNVARNLLIGREISELIHCFHQNDIPVILLKGIYLSEFVYANIGLRTMTDIDLLIPKEKVEKAIEVAQTNGFIPDRPYLPDADGILHYHAPPMAKEGVAIELHWSLTRSSILPGIDTTGLWKRSQTFLWNGVDVQALGLSDLVLHLVIHAAYGHHFFHQLRSLYDLDLVIRKFGNELQWDEIIRICQDWQAEKGSYLAFRLAKELLDTAIPEIVMQQLCPSDWTEHALDWAKTQMFQENPVLSESYIRLMNSRKLGDKIKALKKAFFPSRQVLAVEYGMPAVTWNIVLRYPHYILTRIRNYWGYAWKLLQGDATQQVETSSDQALRDFLGIGLDRG